MVNFANVRRIQNPDIFYLSLLLRVARKMPPRKKDERGKHWRPRIDDERPSRPPRQWPKTPEGQDYDTLTAKHGKPRGPFELGHEPKQRSAP